MTHSRFGRFLMGALALLLLALPVLVANDRGESLDGESLGTWLALSPAIVGLLAYAIPSPPALGTPPEGEPATLEAHGRPVRGTLLAVPRRRRIAYAVMRGAWTLFALVVLAIGLLVVLGGETDDRAGGAVLAVVAGLLALGTAPSAVRAVRAVGDPRRTGLFLAPEGLSLRGAKDFLPWGDVMAADVYTFDFRGMTTRALRVHRHQGRQRRYPESHLPLHPDDVAAVVSGLLRDEQARTRLGSADARDALRWATDLTPAR